MKEFTYKKYSPEYKQQVLDLESSLWHFDDDKKLKYFKWKYEDNPYTDSPEAYIALDGDKVVAFRGYMVHQCKYFDKIFYIAVAGDMVTHPQYRRMGLFKNITEFSMNEIDKQGNISVLTNSSSGGPTSFGYLSLGWKPVCSRKHYFRFNLKGIVRSFFHKETVINEINEYKNNQRFVLSLTCKSKDMASVPFEYKQISHVHDETYYSYRYANPLAKYVFLYKYDNKNQLQAYIVLLSKSQNRYDLIDFNGSEKDISQLLNWGDKKLMPKFILLWSVGRYNCIINNRLKFGFISLNFILDKLKKFVKSPFLVYKLNEKLLNIDVTKTNNWQLYKIISDEI